MPKTATRSSRYHHENENMDVAGDEEREVDELLEDKTDTVTDNPELMAKLREAWQMIWPVHVIVEWVERQPACAACVSQSRKCYPSPQQGSLRCMPCARSRAKPCPLKRQFQIEKSAEVLQLTVEQVKGLVQQADASSSKLPSAPRGSRAKNDQEPAPSHIISAPAPNLEPLSPAYPSTVQNTPQLPQTAPTGLTVKLRSFTGRGVHEQRTHLVEPDPTPGTPIHHSQDSHVTFQDVSPGGRALSILSSPPSSVAERLSSPDMNNSSVREVQLQPPVFQNGNPAPTVVTLAGIDAGIDEEFDEIPVVFASELDRAEEEIARLRSALEAQEKEVARLQRNLKRRDEQLEDIREELDEVIHLPTPRATPASEHENSMRKYTACQYVARTLRALRVDAETEEEREALLLKAERHLGRLANVEMDGMWDAEADADALFTGLVNGSSARAARHAQRGAVNPSSAKTSVSASTIAQQRPSKRRRRGDSD
ncbi:uncharacterized protein F5891DRAFT_995152 [Suillus fuscotomentosus]|uniref:Uncharacterized protein n=1 Tax=Suillus fuscotomentosus TaxID=1912939 RepID=A0AAD4EMI9_9AGAM|nr:uncharacterized protein F5891DRAFT_995152 [Suillus fuscotomentosus]KAG1908837.1 hypothetical protein F5891DRAFT_995152 [Suillus fuscotomentosus]